jgi:hypothetical protein
MANLAELEKRIVLVEHHDEHWYKITVDAKVYYIPSVTTKLGVKDKPFLARWRGDIGNREADMRVYEAQQKGRRIHWAWETALKGGIVIYDPWQAPAYSESEIAALKAKHNGLVAPLRTADEMWHIVRLQRQFQILKPEVLAVEIKVFDLENRDAGTIDHVYKIKEGIYQIAAKPVHLDAGIYVGDLKTGSSVDENVWMQLAPYAYMYEQMFHVELAGALISHSGSNLKTAPGFKTLIRTRDMLMNRDYPDYRHASALWMRDHEDDEPKTYEFEALIKLNLKGEN